MLKHLVDELIPGDTRWPSASEVGVHDVVVLRLFGGRPSPIIEQLSTSLDRSSDGFPGTASTDRTAIVQRFSETQPALFEQIYTATVLAYYEMPAVIEAIRASGRPYSASSHEGGYAMPVFDLERDTPRHGRGSYLRAEEVMPLDLSSLDLDTVKTTKWGLER
jgi:hypothetical protein